MQRVTSQQLLRYSMQQAQRHAAAVGRAQIDVTSGVRIHKPSDDPRGQQIVLERRAALQQFHTRVSAIGDARTRLSIAHQSVRDVQQIIVRVKSLALQARQATDAQEIKALGDEIDGLLGDLVRLANTRHEGEALFGGAATLGTAYATAADGTIQYQGSTLEGTATLTDYGSIKTDYSGRAVFGTSGRGATLVVGATGAAAGTGASSATGLRNLIVRHTTTTFSPGSGVLAGTGTANDTILGPAGAHTLTINDTSGTGASGAVSLNGGPAVAFTSADTNLVVTGPDGEVVHLNTTAITAGFNGTIDVTANGTLSIDGGATTTPITFGANQAVVDSRDGSVVYIDSQSVRRTGTDTIDLTGTADAFQVLAQLRDEVRNLGGLSASDRDAALGRRLEDLDRINDHLLDVVGEQSIALQTLDTLEQHTEDLILEAETTLSETEGTDYADAVLKLQSAQMLLQYSLASAAKLFEISVLNFLD